MQGVLRTAAHNGRQHWRRLLAFAIFGSGIVAAALGNWWFFLVWILGFFVILPALHTLAKPVETRSTAGTAATSGERSEDPALRTLRDRYARGEIDEMEFERRLDGLLASEDAEVRESMSLRERVRHRAELELSRE